MKPYPAGRALRPQKPNQQRGLYRSFRGRGGRPFLAIEDKKGGSFDAHPASSSALHPVVVIPMAAKDFSGFMSQT
jgi:hypothetical protein